MNKNESFYNIVLIQEYIKALIVNINQKHILKDINIIFDGGAFNGGFAAGMAIYLKCMEEHQLIKVHSISGCSIGSVLAVWFLTGCHLKGIAFFEKFMNSYKKNMNLHAYKMIVNEFINELFVNEDEINIINQLNGRLFITYYNVKKHIQKTVSKFRNKDHIIDCILRSSHIPYIMDGQSKYKKKYMDGVTPYIFKNGLPNLFLKLITVNKYARAFMIKSENNIHYRLLTGIADVNDFFTTGNSDMCSFVSNWSYFDFIQLRMREIVLFFIFSLIEWLIILKPFVPTFIINSLLFNGVIKAMHELYIDLIGRGLV